MTRPGRFIEDMKWPEVAEAFAKKIPILIPIGAQAKEHGYHLPMNNDYLLARKLSEALAKELPILVAPIIGFGYYPAFRHYPGSQHLKMTTFISLLTELIENYIDQGNDRIALLNTGYSTEAPISAMLEDVLNRRGCKVYCADIRLLGKNRHLSLKQKRGSHADEHETSLMLYLTPEKVDMASAKLDDGDEPAHIFRQASRLQTQTGAWGDPTLATKEKGQIFFQNMVEELTAGLRLLFSMP